MFAFHILVFTLHYTWWPKKKSDIPASKVRFFGVKFEYKRSTTVVLNILCVTYRQCLSCRRVGGWTVTTRPLRGTWVCSASSGSEYLRVGREVGANSSSTSIMGSWNGDTALTDSALDDLRSRESYLDDRLLLHILLLQYLYLKPSLELFSVYSEFYWQLQHSSRQCSFRHDKFLTFCMFVVDFINGLSDELTKRTIADWQLDLTIRLTNRLTIQLTIQLFNSALQFILQFGWPKWVQRSERASSDSTMVQSGCRVLRRKRVSRAEAFTGGR